MLYGIRIAEGKKQYPINDTGAEITDEFKKGLIKGLGRVLWCTQKKEQLVKKRYDDADEALIASFFESECIPNCIERLKNKLHSANIDKGDTMRTKEDILTEINKIKHSINRGRSTSETAYKVGMVDGLYYTVGDIESDNTDLQDDNVVTVNIKYELDKAAYKQYVAEMKDIEAEMKHESDLIEEYEKATMYKTAPEASEEVRSKLKLDKDCVFFGAAHVPEQKTIPATIKDVCEWWIKEYPDHVLYYKTEDHKSPMDTSYDKIRRHMKKILENI